MNQQDQRNRQQGGSQQEAFSQGSRQQGGSESPRQPQGDYGSGRDRNDLSSGSGDWRHEQDYRGGYRDDQSQQAWRSRSEHDDFGSRHGSGQRDTYDPYRSSGGYGGGQHSQWSDYGDQGREYRGAYGQYGQYGLRDREDDRFGSYQGDPRRYERPSGMDRDYRGAGYAGPGGYGGGYGGSPASYERGPGYGGGRREREQFDPDYDQWRREQVRALDEDYNQWREDRFKKFSEEFSTWRNQRSQQRGTTGKTEAGTTPSKSNKDNS